MASAYRTAALPIFTGRPPQRFITAASGGRRRAWCVCADRRGVEIGCAVAGCVSLPVTVGRVNGTGSGGLMARCVPGTASGGVQSSRLTVRCRGGSAGPDWTRLA